MKLDNFKLKFETGPFLAVLAILAPQITILVSKVTKRTCNFDPATPDPPAQVPDPPRPPGPPKFSIWGRFGVRFRQDFGTNFASENGLEDEGTQVS